MVFAALVFSACKTTKLVPPGQYLLVKNKIKSQDETNNLFVELTSKLDNDQAIYIKHKPNRKILGVFKFHMGMYRFGTSIKNPWKNDSLKWRKYLRRIGEAPVILDTLEVIKSETNLRNFLFGKGFYNSTITHQIKYKNRKAIVTYYVNPQKAYIIDKVNLAADDAEVDAILNDTMDNSHLKKGAILDVENIAKERNRLTLVMRNKGYYDFTKDVFDFELDTLRSKNGVNVNISVANKSDDERFQRKKISKVNVIFQNDTETQVVQGVVHYANLDFYFNGYPVKPYILSQKITVRPGDYFSQDELENTNNRLSELPIFKFIEISYANDLNDTTNALVMNIQLKTGFRQAFIFEPQGLVSQLNRIQSANTSNSYGIAANVGWSHKNLFRNSEQFDITSTTRFETQLLILNGVRQQSTQQSINASLSIPRSAFLKPLESWRYVRSIRTNLNLSFLYELNPDYTRRIMPLTYQYQIQTKKNSTWFLNLIELSYSQNDLRIDITGQKDSALISRLFGNNLVTSTGLNFIYNNKNTRKGRSFFIVRTNVIEFGGNIHRQIRNWISSDSKKDTSYKLLGVNYFQYAKSEVDARCSTLIDENSSTCFRLNVGLAYPYGNQKILSFDKLFFIGGSNSLRGWRPRTIGPGSYNDNNSNFRIDRAGDIIIQGNAEYRFDLIDKVLQGAVFFDGGNVWLARSNSTTDPRKVLKFKNLYNDLAFNTGVGFRFDFQFFLFRLDWGWQIHNPELDIKERWVISDFARNKYFNKYSVLNFGIGYPF